MIKIGLTGGIGCGKSLVAEFLKKEGVKIIHADIIAKDIINKNSIVKSMLMIEFSDDIYTNDGVLDRKKAADIIFSDNNARDKINAIVHPFVKIEQANELKKIEDSNVVDIAGVEAALIYEAHTEYQFDFIIVVSASLDKIITRLKNRDSLTESEILNRINSQMPLDRKIKQADYVISNNGSIEQLDVETKKLTKWLKNKLI